MNSLITLPEYQSLSSWYETTGLRFISSGCEGEIWSAEFEGMPVKLKLFRRDPEFKRWLIGGALLSSVLAEHGWTNSVRVPHPIAIDCERLVAVSELVTSKASDDDEAAEQRCRAMTALICAAGHIMSMAHEELESRTVALRAFGISLEECFVFGGVDLSEPNLIYDGKLWWAVDF